MIGRLLMECMIVVAAVHVVVIIVVESQSVIVPSCVTDSVDVS